MLARRLGAKSTLVLINEPAYQDFAGAAGVDAYINPRAVTISRVLQHVRKGRIRSVYAVQNGMAEVIEAEALETSPLVGKALRELELPEGIRIGALYRDKAYVRPDGNTRIKAKGPRGPPRGRRDRPRCRTALPRQHSIFLRASAMPRIAYVNGTYVRHAEAAIHVEDRGYQFADGVYEVCEVRHGFIIDLTRHLDRLGRSLGELRIGWPMSRAALIHVIREVLRRNRVRNGLFYLQVTRESRGGIMFS